MRPHFVPRSLSLCLVLTVCTSQLATAQQISAKDLLLPKPTTPAAIKSELSFSKLYGLSIGGGNDTLSAVDAPNTVFFATLGRGYNPFTGKVGVVCVESVSQDQELPGSVPEVFMNTVSDEKSMAHASASSVSASGMFKFVSASVGTSSTNSSMFNSGEKYGRVYARIATKITDRQDLKWSAAAQKLIDDRDFSGFLNTCGTRFVRTVYAGHLLDESVHFKLNEDTMTASSATSLSVGVGKIFGGSASFCSAQASMSAYSTVELKSYGLGVLSLPTLPSQTSAAGAPQPANPNPAPGSPPAPAPASTSAGCAATASTPAVPPSPLQTLIDYYNDGFRTAVVADNKKSAVPLYVVMDRYVDHAGSVPGLLQGTDHIPVWIDELLEAVLAKGDTYNDLIGAISDSAFAASAVPVSGATTSNLSVFYTEDEPSRVQKLKAAKELLLDFQKSLNHCRSLALAGIETVPDPNRPGSTAPAVTVCQDDLNAKLTDERVGAVKLTRKYK